MRTTATFFLTFNFRQRRHSSGRTRSRAKSKTILKQTKGVQFVTSINGFSLLNRVSASYNGFALSLCSPGTSARKLQRKS